MIYQAIVTKFIGPTNFRSARIKATAAAGSVILSYDHVLNLETNHARAALKLAAKMKWDGKYVGGGMPDGSGNCFVCLGSDKAAFPDFEVRGDMLYLRGIDGAMSQARMVAGAPTTEAA
jgi:hypothetical protein